MEDSGDDESSLHSAASFLSDRGEASEPEDYNSMNPEHGSKTPLHLMDESEQSLHSSGSMNEAKNKKKKGETASNQSS